MDPTAFWILYINLLLQSLGELSHSRHKQWSYSWMKRKYVLDLVFKWIFMTLANSASDKQTFLASNYNVYFQVPTHKTESTFALCVSIPHSLHFSWDLDEIILLFTFSAVHFWWELMSFDGIILLFTFSVVHFRWELSALMRLCYYLHSVSYIFDENLWALTRIFYCLHSV